MSWPLSQDYNEAIQSPATNFSDPDLKKGQAVCNNLGIPIPCSGNFADVYQVRCPDGSRWAVKCFTREVPGLRERYQLISAHLKQARLPFIVDFSYLDQGIRVHGQWYPILKMQWVEGLTLNQFVAQYVEKPAMLEALLQIWLRTATRLRGVSVAHGDFQHGNILLVPGASTNSLALKLIDYDGMWVPALADKRSGEDGHANYQHPQRARERIYNAEVDRFPLLLIATALRALKLKGKELWDKYDNGENLLFKEADLLAPLRSLLFLDLTKIDDGIVRSQVDSLIKGLRQGLDCVPLLQEVMPEQAAAPPTPRPPLARLIVPVANTPAPPAEPWYADISSRTALTAASRSKRNKRTAVRSRLLIVGAALAFLLAAAGVGIWASPRQQAPRPAPVPVPPPKDHEPKVHEADGTHQGKPPENLAPTPEQLIVELEDPSASKRQNAALELGGLREKAGPEGVTGLRKHLLDKDATVRRNAAEALGLVGKPLAHSAVGAMFTALKAEKDEAAQKATIDALSRLVGPEDRGNAPVLLPFLDNADIKTRYNAALMLADFGRPEAVRAVPALGSALNGDDARCRELASAALVRLGADAAPAAEDLGRALVGAKEPEVRDNAAKALRAIGPASKKALPQLIQALKRTGSEADPHYILSNRRDVAEAVGHIPYPDMVDAIPALLDVVKADPDREARMSAAVALSQVQELDRYQITPVLTAVLNENGRDANGTYFRRK
jgi:HEAT repeat protein